MPALVALLACGCGGASQPRPQPSSGGAPAACRPLQLRLPRLGGGRVSLEALRGRPVVLVLFATWSLRCQTEATWFVQQHERHGERVGFVGVALDRRGRKLVETYVEFVGFRFPVALATPDDLDLAAAVGPTRAVPRTLLLDRRGCVVQDHREGQTDFGRLEAGIARLLR